MYTPVVMVPKMSKMANFLYTPRACIHCLLLEPRVNMITKKMTLSFSSTLRALFVGIFHSCISRPSKFSSMPSPAPLCNRFEGERHYQNWASANKEGEGEFGAFCDNSMAPLVLKPFVVSPGSNLAFFKLASVNLHFLCLSFFDTGFWRECFRITLKVLNFAIFNIFEKFLYLRKVSKPQYRETIYPWNVPRSLNRLIFDWSMISIPAYLYLQ